jgi:trans-aconitate 2-methyltransferase
MDTPQNGVEPTNPGYAFGDSQRAVARLALLAQVFETPSRALLNWVDARSIEVAIDLGCGPGFSTRLLNSVKADVVVGIDASSAFLECARTLGPSSARWHRHDVTSVPLPSGPADLLYARLLLAHLPRPEMTVLAWLAELRPGGYLVLEEDQFIDSNHQTLSDYDELSASLVACRGGDLYVGRRLTNLEVPRDYRRIVDRVYRHHVPIPVAAELFSMNFVVWRHDPWVIEQRGVRWLDGMERDLARLADSEAKGSVVFAIRQVIYQCKPATNIQESQVHHG